MYLMKEMDQMLSLIGQRYFARLNVGVIADNQMFMLM